MARMRRTGLCVAGELNLVAMIDVAFQLLSFFLITIVPVATMTDLTVMRPRPPDNVVVTPRPLLPALRITVLADGYTLNERLVNGEQLKSQLRRLVGIDKTQGIFIHCQNESTHGKLVNVLDVCAELNLINLFVVSSDV